MRKYRLRWNKHLRGWEYRPLSNLPPVGIIQFMADLNRLNTRSAA